MADRTYFSVLAMLRAKYKSPAEIGKRLNMDAKTVKNVLDELAKSLDGERGPLVKLVDLRPTTFGL